jgi:RHS repeat-associated protein
MRYTSLQYFYHPDHLGSASWITDAAGEGYQHFQYLPFGESWVEHRLGSYNTPYQFSGKEKDEETGYNYFGARYYDSELSVWLSVDPMAEKYPSLSCYTFIANNPIKYRDPDGRIIKAASDWSFALLMDAFGTQFKNDRIVGRYFDFHTENNLSTNNGQITVHDGMGNMSKHKFMRDLKEQSKRYGESFSRRERKALYSVYRAAASSSVYEIAFIDPVESNIGAGIIENSNIGFGNTSSIFAESREIQDLISSFSNIESKYVSRDQSGNAIRDSQGKLVYDQAAFNSVVAERQKLLNSITDGTGVKRFSNGNVIIDTSKMTEIERDKAFIDNIGER